MELRRFLHFLLCVLWPMGCESYSLRSVRQIAIPPPRSVAQQFNPTQLSSQLSPSQQVPQASLPSLQSAVIPATSSPKLPANNPPSEQPQPNFNNFPPQQQELPSNLFNKNAQRPNSHIFLSNSPQIQQQSQFQQQQQQLNHLFSPQTQSPQQAVAGATPQNPPQARQPAEGGVDSFQTTTLPPQPTPRIVPPPVDKNVDLDGDGALSLAEVQYAAFVHHGLSSSVVENLFNEVDKNKDGYLTSIEFNEIRPLVLAKAENAALRYLQSVDTDHNGLLSLGEAQNYILKEYGISNRDVERIWRLTVPSSSDEMDAVLFSKLRRRIRGMSIRLARQIMKIADRNEDGHIDLKEAQMIAFEQEGIGAGDVIEMSAGVDDNNDGELNAPEFADFQRIVRARAVETSKKALKVVDTDGSDSITMNEAKQIAFDHYGFEESTLEPFFAQADENEDGQLDAVEFAGFRSVIRSRAVKNALNILPDVDEDGDGLVNMAEAEKKARREDDLETKEIHNLFNVADQDRSGALDKVELADFVRLVRLSAIKYVNDHFREYDKNRDKLVTIDELEQIVKDRYHVEPATTKKFFDRADVDRSADLNAGEIVDFRHEVRRHVSDRKVQAELEVQNRREMAEIEAKLRSEAEEKKHTESSSSTSDSSQDSSEDKDSQEEKANTQTAAPSSIKPFAAVVNPADPVKHKDDKPSKTDEEKRDKQLSGETNGQESGEEEADQQDDAQTSESPPEDVGAASTPQQPSVGKAEEESGMDERQFSPESETSTKETIQQATTTTTQATTTTTREDITTPQQAIEDPQKISTKKKGRKSNRKKFTARTTIELETTSSTTASSTAAPNTSASPETTQKYITTTEAPVTNQQSSISYLLTTTDNETSPPLTEAISEAAEQQASTIIIAKEVASTAKETITMAPAAQGTSSVAGTPKKRRKSKKQRTTTTTTTTSAYDDEEEEGEEETETPGPDEH